MQRRWLPILLGCAFLLLVSLPYLWAFQSGGESHVFGGFLLNPLDGNSYLAKMYQGWQGEWRFKLPFTAEPGQGGYLFLFYLAMGHLAKFSSIDKVVIFHVVRLAGGLALVISLWDFFGKIFPLPRARLLSFGLALFGSGMGWLASAWGLLSPDLWVAEGYPFLSAYANPHFPFGLAIMLWILSKALGNTDQGKPSNSTPEMVSITGGAILLGIMMPFGVVITAVLLAALTAWHSFDAKDIQNENGSKWDVLRSKSIRSPAGKALLLVLLGGGPVLIYQFWVASSDPVLSLWNAQNLTPSPPFGELLIAYSPILLLAIPGVFLAVRGESKGARLLIVWGGLGLLLLYVPWGLQRRFILGYMIPLAGLAAVNLERLFSKRRSAGVVVLVLIILLMLPTNLIVLTGGLQAAQKVDQRLYLSAGELEALRWLERNTPQQAVVLASPGMGIFIPAYSGRRVLYGHPFETPHAARMEELVLHFFSTGGNAENQVALDNADYIFYGNRESQLGEFMPSPDMQLVFNSSEVQIYLIQ